MGRAIKVAIVHDWLVGGGAERVTFELHRMFPEAPIYTSYCTPEWRERLDDKVVTGYLQHFPRLRKVLILPRIWWFSRLDLSGYDIVISVSGNGEAFGVRTPPATLHINYCNTPTHYYWRLYDLYLERPGFGRLSPLVRLALRLLVGPLRRWDYKAAQRADVMLANSHHIQADIKRYYQRDSVVVHPPVDVARFAVPEPQKRQGFVIAGRQVPQKRFELPVLACSKLGLPLTVIGKGPEHANLVAMAGPTVTFREHVNDDEMPKLLAAAEAFIFPSLEDFGIVPVEAQAAGTPVIAFEAGGPLDYVIPSKTGLFFKEQTVDSLVAALKTFPNHHFNHQAIRQAAQNFSPEHFEAAMRQVIQQALNKE